MEKKLSFRQKIHMLIYGHVFLRHEQKEGWSKANPIYLVKCSKHGYYEDTPHGWEQKFYCLQCLEEFRRNHSDLFG